MNFLFTALIPSLIKCLHFAVIGTHNTKGAFLCQNWPVRPVSLQRTRRSVSVNWVTCGTCYTKIEGNELGGIEGAKTGCSQE